MKELLQKIYDANKNNAFGALIKLIALILGSEVIQLSVNVLFSIYTSFHFARSHTITKAYGLIVIIYIVLLGSFALLNQINKRRRKDAESLAKVSRELQNRLRYRMKLIDSTCTAYVKGEGTVFNTEIERESDLLCDAIYSTLSEYLDYTDLEVVAWQIAKDEEKTIVVTPVSFGTKAGIPPTWLNGEYPVMTIDHYRIVECFMENRTHIFLTRRKCQEELYYSTEEERNETKTHQFIAVPVRKKDGFTHTAIQIRTFKENVIPNDEDKANLIIENFIQPFATYFELVMEEQRAFEDIIDYEKEQNK